MLTTSIILGLTLLPHGRVKALERENLSVSGQTDCKRFFQRSRIRVLLMATSPRIAIRDRNSVSGIPPLSGLVQKPIAPLLNLLV